MGFSASARHISFAADERSGVDKARVCSSNSAVRESSTTAYPVALNSVKTVRRISL